jgi:hypothetical protein
MLLRDAEGGSFEANDIEGVVDRYRDVEMGELARVRLNDGSHRIVRVAELDLAAMDSTKGSVFFASWPTWPGSA